MFDPWLSKLQFTCSEEHFEKGSGLWGKVFKLSLKYIRHGCQNYSLRVQRSTLRKVIFFWDFFKIVFGLCSIIVQNSGENVQQCFQMCILRVRGTFSFFLWMVLMFFLTSDSGEKTISFEKKFRHFCWNCILSVPRTFWGVFIQNVLVFQFSLVFQAKFIELPAEIFQQSSKMHFEPKLFEVWRNFSTESSKRHFKSPEEHIDKNNKLTLWNNFRLWARKCLICGGNFAALISNLLFCPQMGNWKNSFERIFTFSDFFRTSREHVFGFFGVSFEAWWSKLNSSSQDEHIH